MSPSSRVVALALGVLLVLASAAVGLSTAQAQTTDMDTYPSNTTILIELQEDGAARWTVSMQVELSSAEAIESFRTVATAFENNESNVLTVSTFRQYVDLSSRATGRSMELTNVSRTATVDNQTGRLALGFTWSEFGLREGNRLTVGDAFAKPDGTWLEGLTDGQRLVIEAPETFEITSAPKGFTNKTIEWSGPRTFSPSYLSITYNVETTETTTRTSTPETATPLTTASPPVNSDGISLALVVIALVVAALVGLYLYRSGLLPPGDDGDDAGAARSTDDDDGSGSSQAAEAEPDSHPGETGAETDTQADAAPLPDRELLSDEEYVEALIERNGGRMKQADIVTETGWSNAKVSQLLSAMAEEGRVDKLRIGRENLISFPDEDELDGDGES